MPRTRPWYPSVTPQATTSRAAPSGADDTQDSVFITTILKDDASLPVTSGNNTQTFDVKVGANAFTVPTGLGKQSCFVSRNGAAVGGLSGDSL